MTNLTNRAQAVPPMRLVGKLAAIQRRAVLAKHYAHLVAINAPERLNPIWSMFDATLAENFVK